MQIERITQAPDREIWRGDRPALAALEALRDDPNARDSLSRCIVDAPYEGLFWECRRIELHDEKPFEFAMIDSPRVAILRANPAPFRAAFAGADVVQAFDNLGGQSRLVSPVPGDALAPGAHLAAFLRRGSRAQIHALWRCVADEALRWMQSRTLWLSTSGLGVSWLHVRLDPRPKYYAHGPYRTE